MDFVGMLLIGPAVSSEVFTSDKLTQVAIPARGTEFFLAFPRQASRYILGEDEGYELVKVITGDVITTFSYDGVTYTSSSPRQVFQFTRSHGAPVEILADDKVLVAQFIMPDFGDYTTSEPEDFVGIVTSMQNDLRVNRKELSRYKRTKTSAQDPRASAMREMV
nr:hypothetical protein BaRGS_032305 [Batillaria attramentaria]